MFQHSELLKCNFSSTRPTFRMLTSGETERPQRTNEGVTLLANEGLIPAAKLTVLPLNPLEDLLNHSTEVDRCPAESGVLGWVAGVPIILSPIIDCVSEVCDLEISKLSFKLHPIWGHQQTPKPDWSIAAFQHLTSAAYFFVKKISCLMSYGGV